MKLKNKQNLFIQFLKRIFVTKRPIKLITVVFFSVGILFVFASSTFLYKGDMPLVYDVENNGFNSPEPTYPTIDELPSIHSLTDPFEWSDGSGRIKKRSDWQDRRAEIAYEIQHYELGVKPPTPENIEATFDDGILTVTVEENGNKLELTAEIELPEGDGPFPAIIGVGFGGTGSLPRDIFTSRNIATIRYNSNQVAPHTSGYGEGGFFELYPEDKKIGAFLTWAWGVSRIIDGLEIVANEAKIDLSHLAITGCSYAGKIALYSGAFDERIALVIPQEPGGGGDAAWRVSDAIQDTLPEGKSVENLAHAQGVSWYYYDLRQFNDFTYKLPYDHHELIAMVAPRAFLLIGNPSMEYLADESGYVSCMAAKEVWKALGIPDRFGFTRVGGHGHCQLPESMWPELIAFVEKFLLGNTEVNTDVAISPYSTDINEWITWETLELK